MADRWLGVVVSGDRVVMVDAEIDGANPLILQSDQTLTLQSGNRAEAYSTIAHHLADYVREHSIKRVVVKESAISRNAATKALLQSAELRGVVMSACGGVVRTDVKSKASISRTFGDRKVDEYVADNDFWTKQVAGANLRMGSREAAIVLLAARNDQ
ncbi:hypothetical protein [Bradyrhizobium sp. 2S1]|uniref:hypothetical protein n=1 Tax=Bradyrhizobium sp. 2S1 TaxID=1404429 RepID=UPI00140D1F94|nr:hypothetical protein [Bradyrhizobium sp. 2S1]MCK7669334.1 hypothetical protein [Bradyrhizobium sp. 2S1]